MRGRHAHAHGERPTGCPATHSANAERRVYLIDPPSPMRVEKVRDACFRKNTRPHVRKKSSVRVPWCGLATGLQDTPHMASKRRHRNELSDALRLFPHQAVRRGGRPSMVRDPSVSVVSGKRLWDMKRRSQARDRDLIARGVVAPESMLFLRPHHLKGVRVEWPDVPLQDE